MSVPGRAVNSAVGHGKGGEGLVSGIPTEQGPPGPVSPSVVQQSGTHTSAAVNQQLGPETGRMVRRLSSLCLCLGAVALLGTTGVALWLGFADLFLPVSLAAQLLGLVYFLAGVAGLAGLAGFVSLTGLARRLSGKRPPPWLWKTTDPPTWQIASVFGGAVAGCYVDVTIVWYSVGYQSFITWLFIVPAVFCFGLACVMMSAVSAVWKYIANGLKGIGIFAALLGLGAQFWYISIYAPDNTPVGINTAFVIGPMTGTGSDRVVQVDLTMEDAGPVAAIALGSILVVNGISYPSGNRTLLKVLQPIGDNSFLFPDDKDRKSVV